MVAASVFSSPLQKAQHGLSEDCVSVPGDHMAGLIQHDIVRMGNQVEQLASPLIAEHVALESANQ